MRHDAVDGEPSPPPHSIQRYAEFLREGAKHGVVFIPMPAIVENSVAIALRHDVDAEPQKARLFLEAERAAGVQACYYFIVDGVVPEHRYTYALEDCVTLVREIRAQGSHAGLHSIAWSRRDSMSVLQRERERFREVFGFAPASETHHGFLDAAVTRKLRRRFDLAFLRSTHRFFESARTIVLSDSEGKPLRLSLRYDALVSGVPYEIMTHPEHWTA